MSSANIRQLLRARASQAGLSIDDPLLDQLHAYLNLLSRWNTRINLTGFSLSPPTAQAIDRLLIEPLQLAQALKYPLATWVDLGSGGGSPAIPIQLYKPATSLVLVESKARKAAFLREATRELQLSQVRVEVTRIESIDSSHQLAGTADLVTIRAVSLSKSILAALRALLRTGGCAALLGSVHSKAGVRLAEAGFQVTPNVDLRFGVEAVLASKA
jgi:16S rRNA (guanine527-N7)-methyltransferase